MRKIFNHQFVPFTELQTETINGARHYVLPDGLTKLKSVTTIISENTDKTALFEWRKRVGEVEANKISTQAARRGTSIHSIAERYVLNKDDYLKGEMPANAVSFNAIKPIIDANVDNVLGVELPLYSKSLRCAGRTDLVAQFNGITSIIDFKTARKTKKEEWIEGYFLQSTVYSMLFEWTYNIKVPQIVILISVDHEEPQVFIKDRSLYVEKVLSMFAPRVFS
jgi:genome maintenance exonuclease 1